MMKRSATPAPWEVEEFDSTSGTGLVETDAVGEVNPVFRSTSPAEPEEAPTPSPSHVSTSDFEQVESPSRLEVEPVS